MNPCITQTRTGDGFMADWQRRLPATAGRVFLGCIQYLRRGGIADSCSRSEKRPLIGLKLSLGKANRQEKYHANQ